MQAHDAGLSPAEHRRLVGALALLGSDKLGERDAAAAAAVRILRNTGLDWLDLIPPPAAEPSRADLQQSTGEAVRALDLALRHRDQLDAWRRSFVDGLLKRRKPFTPKQVAKLTEIAADLRASGCR